MNNKKIVLIKKRINGLETIISDNSHNYKRSINYKHFIKLALYNSIILSIMIYLINLI